MAAVAGDNQNDGGGVLEESLVGGRHADARHVRHMADAGMVPGQGAAEGLEGVHGGVGVCAAAAVFPWRLLDGAFGWDGLRFWRHDRGEEHEVGRARQRADCGEGLGVTADELGRADHGGLGRAVGGFVLGAVVVE